ncbi:MFS transporter [Chromohalobacter israelensis]|uniref:Major facilitator superfamily MFS_1 n=1 Tax=Chromohalobacter israelensis (strain ATCC BAA-138 / DSM 3043 / CIP 106854 / NCIMB 13768 / 1H11) TaxID=290398 RepID=Q1QZK1_CHRI1|nr:major facilitator superfamily MFS_1 [Chromohalobacter salexigens DSM 3043]
MTRGTHSTTYLVAIGAFALGMASYVTAGLIPMIQADFTVSVSVAAQLVTAFTLAYGLGSPLCVALLPAHRQRGGLFLMLGLFVIANAASALTTSLAALMAWRVLAGMAAGTYLAIGIAAAVGVAPAGARGKTISIIMGGMASGTVLGVPLGLILAERWGWQAALWLIALIGLMALVGLIFRLPPMPATQVVPMRRKLSILTDRRVIGLLGISLLAAIASLGMYTFIAPLIDVHGERSVTPYLWVWGVGGVLGSFLIGTLVDRFSGPRLTFSIMLLLGIALIALPLLLDISSWLALIPIALWGAVGWALQVPQNNELMKAREPQGDGNLAVALNANPLSISAAPLAPRSADSPWRCGCLSIHSPSSPGSWRYQAWACRHGYGSDRMHTEWPAPIRELAPVVLTPPIGRRSVLPIGFKMAGHDRCIRWRLINQGPLGTQQKAPCISVAAFTEKVQNSENRQRPTDKLSHRRQCAQ